jgi:phosphatidylserine/phosphatidylglycerophosphate/cardiolipin synthase-like enzyme
MIIGSANCTYNSFTNCEEADVATQSPVLLASHIDHFAMLWESSIEVDWDELEKQEDAALLKKRLALDDKRARSPSRNR